MNKYIRTYCITGADIDTEYRIHRNAVIAFFQDCVANYYTSKHQAAFDIVHNDLMWVIFDFNVKFEGDLPFWSEAIRVEVWMSEITKVRMYVDFQLYDSEDNIFAKGNSCWNIIRISDKKLMATDSLDLPFELCNELTLGPHKRISFTHGPEIISTYKHKINYNDLDFNHHVSNRNYLNMASVNSTPEFFATHTLHTLSVKFMRESFLNDELICVLYPQSDQPGAYVNIIKRESDHAEICLISTQWMEREKGRDILDYMKEVRNLKLKS